ncbi:MAG: FtsW/RodA/SpoVE family cell cycle protein, partial [Bryobacterales bacterium]|nr:FtsW/RodA/SpoVE family cell cycle protein [Bryobacterales bacterium]
MIARNYSFRDLDWMLLFSVVAICLIGIVQIYSATSSTPLDSYWWKQCLYLVVGLCLMTIVGSLDYHVLVEHVPVLYAIIIAGLVGVMLFAPRINGAKSWIPL